MNERYPRERTAAVQQYEDRMRAVDPSHKLLLIDFWDPELANQFDDLRREKGGWVAGDIAGYTARYRKTSWLGLSVELEIQDRDTGRRLRQDGSKSSEMLDVLSTFV